jgi:cell division protein FtsI/penicillin-binding protein 2
MYHSPYQKSHKKPHTLEERFQSLLQKIPRLSGINFTREVWLIILFFLLFGVIIIRLFYLQIIQHQAYDAKLNSQHTRSTSVKANRGNIYALDKSGQPVKLTENMTLYDIALDPTLI